MATDTTTEADGPSEGITREQVLHRLLHDRYDCRQCPYFKRRGRQLISHCVRHLEELMAELSLAPKKPEK